MKDKVLAVDIGTSSVRCMIVDILGNIIYKVQSQYDVIIVDKYMQEQDPNLISQITFDTIRRCISESSIDKYEISGIGFSSQMYNIFPVDKQGKPLYNMIIWSDSRSEEQAEKMKLEYESLELNLYTGCPMNSLFPITKIQWLKENETSIYENTAKFISIKEYVLHKMTGEYVIDYSIASATGLFDIRKLDWHPKALSLIGLKKEQLSLAISGTKQLKFGNYSLCSDLGLSQDTIIISGGGDGPLANIGSGAYQSGAINIDLGTSGAARVITTEPITDVKSRVWTFALTDHLWVYGGILSNVGNGYNWLISNIKDYLEDKTYIEILFMMDQEFSKIPPGSNDLLFLPYLLKARSPYWDDKIKATIYGLTHQHRYSDIVKAYLESIGYCLASMIDIISENVAVLPDIVLTGGLAVSENLAQMLADILGKGIKTIKSNEGSLMGVAIMTLKGVGFIERYELPGIHKFAKEYVPNIENYEKYRKMIKKYNILQDTIHNMDMI